MIILGVSGASGSGKSLLAKNIVSKLGSKKVVIISEDSYYKSHENLTYKQRCDLNFDDPSAFDHALLADHLSKLKQGKDIQVPVYDFTTHSRSDQVQKVSADNVIVILEGILIFHESGLRKLMDMKIFVDTDLDLALIRRLKRDISQRGRTVECVLSQYEKDVRPMYYKYIEPSKRFADLKVPHGGENKIAVDMITAKMKDFLSLV